MIKGVIFDMDGVMIDSERQSNYGWLSAAKEKNVEMPMWLIDSFKGAPAKLSKQYFDDYFKGQLDYWETRQRRSDFVHELRKKEGIPIKKGLYELLEYIRLNGLKCAVATSTYREGAYKTLSIIGAKEYLDGIVFGDEVENGKPAPDIFLKAASQLNLKPSECIVIEDSINGIKAGYNAKMRVVHVPDTIIIDDEIRALTSKVCEDLGQIPEVIEEWNRAEAGGNRQNAGCSKAAVNEETIQSIDRAEIKRIFVEYAASYNVQDDKIRLKIEHTYRVASHCEHIAKSLVQSAGLTRQDIDMAWFIGMFHDIGRFEQVRRYGTFYDAESIDHAALSADITFGADAAVNYNADNEDDNGRVIGAENNDMQNEFCDIAEDNSMQNACGTGAYIADKILAATNGAIDMRIAELAVRNHNVYRLPDNLTDRERMFCNILRDADKVDILMVCVTEPPEAVYGVTDKELKSCRVSDEVMEAFLQEETVLKSIRKTPIDKLVGHISLVFELVYPESLLLATVMQDYLSRLLKFPTENEKAQQQFAVIRQKMAEYLEENGIIALCSKATSEK